MSSITKDAELRRAYGEIVAGFSTFGLNKKMAYLRHLSPLDQGALDKEYLRLYNTAITEGLLNEADRMKLLDKDGVWTTQQEDKMLQQEIYVRGLEETKRNLALPSQVKLINKDIEDSRIDLISQRAQKYSVLGLTAEAYANKKLNELYVFNSLFRDRSFTQSFFEEEEYDELDEFEIAAVVEVYNKGISHINEQVIQHISLSPFFTKYFYLCENNIFNFYGKPIATLTYFQSELANCGIYFKHIFSGESRPPEHIAQDPERIIEWYQTSTNTNKILGNTKGENVGMFGATEEDLKDLGLQPEGKSPFDLAKEKGVGDGPKKTLSMKELASM